MDERKFATAWSTVWILFAGLCGFGGGYLAGKKTADRWWQVQNSGITRFVLDNGTAIGISAQCLYDGPVKGNRLVEPSSTEPGYCHESDVELFSLSPVQIAMGHLNSTCVTHSNRGDTCSNVVPWEKKLSEFPEAVQCKGVPNEGYATIQVDSWTEDGVTITVTNSGSGRIASLTHVMCFALKRKA